MYVTNIAQSNALFKLGFNPKLADFAYKASNNGTFSLRIVNDEEPLSIENNEIPAWSLEELLFFLPRCITANGKKYQLIIHRTRPDNLWCIKYTNGGTLIRFNDYVYLSNAAYAMVRYLLTDGKKYLE